MFIHKGGRELTVGKHGVLIDDIEIAGMLDGCTHGAYAHPLSFPRWGFCVTKRFDFRQASKRAISLIRLQHLHPGEPVCSRQRNTSCVGLWLGHNRVARITSSARDKRKLRWKHAA
jgi:hypothetical protein